MCLSVVKGVCPVMQVFCERFQDILWCPSLTIEFMVSSAVHVWRKPWEHESLWCHGAMAMGIPHHILWYPYLAKNPKTSLLCAGYHGSLWYPCLVEEDMRLAAMRRVPWGAGRRSWVALYCGFHRSWRRLHRFQLDGTAWQCHPSHPDPWKPGPAVRRHWREKRRTKMGGGGAKRRGGREWGD